MSITKWWGDLTTCGTINMEMIKEDPVITWKKRIYYPVMITDKIWLSNRLAYHRYNPTYEVLTDGGILILCYADVLGEYCDFDLSLKINLFMQQIQQKIDKFNVGGPWYSNGNRFFGCTALQNEKGWK